jgi:uncharacterized protein (TIGR02246 family)
VPAHQSAVIVAFVDTDALERLVGQAEAAWNSHDMAAFAALFSADADFVNVAGWWWQGRDEIEAMHARLHQTIFAASQMEMRLAGSTRIGDDVFVVHVRWRMSGQGAGGAREASGPREGIWTWVVVGSGGRPQIVASHNSDTLPVPANHPLAGMIRGGRTGG